MGLDISTFLRIFPKVSLRRGNIFWPKRAPPINLSLEETTKKSSPSKTSDSVSVKVSLSISLGLDLPHHLAVSQYHRPQKRQLFLPDGSP